MSSPDGGKLSKQWACSSSSDTSSSISVISVPLDVTGEGPTISLELGICMEYDETRLTELGRRDRRVAESVAGGGEDTTLNGERSPPVSGDADISASVLKRKCRLPFEYVRGPFKAIVTSGKQDRKE